VNPRQDSDLQVECTLKASVADAGASQVLHDADRNGYNSFDNPDRVVPKQQPIKVKASKMQLDLPRLSVTTIIVPIH